MLRRDFLLSGCAHLLVCATLPPLLVPEAAAAPEPHRGGRVAWARLVTTDPQWQRHTRSDGDLADFIRSRTSLNLDPTWYSATPARLDDLCAYPLIFSTDLATLTAPAERANLREYIERGGFLFVDACINTEVNPDPDVFLDRNAAFFRALWPAAILAPLLPDHPIYRCYFQLPETPPHTYMGSVYNPAWARHPLYAIQTGGRTVAVISLSGLQCGWDRMARGIPGHADRCMEMVVNIYVHAMNA